MEVLIKAAQFILSLSFLVILHELGHFIPAKLFKTRVEKFYLFFDPYFSLVKKKIGSTEYGIGWLPLGGYVKIAGMIDESMDTEQMKKPAEPWEFRSKPAWQRLIIMVGGVAVNVVLAILIYAMVLFTWGTEEVETKDARYGVNASEFAESLGIQDGDKVLAVDGEYVPRIQDINFQLVMGARTMELDRDGAVVKLQLPENLTQTVLEDKTKSQLVSLALPFFIGQLDESGLAYKHGLQLGDRMLGVNNVRTVEMNSFIQEMKKHAGEEIVLHYERNGEKLSKNIQLGESAKLGIGNDTQLGKFFNISVKEYGFFESIPAGYDMTIATLDKYVQQAKMILNPQSGAYKHLGGFLTMGSQMSPTWDWYRFWNYTAFLSIVLAFMNILPIPALDGGHVMFLLYEVFTGRKPNEKIMEYAQMAGIIFLLGLMLLANGNDVVNLVKSWLN